MSIWDDAGRRVQKFLSIYQRKFHNLFLYYLTNAHRDISSAFSLIESMQEEYAGSRISGFGLWHVRKSGEYPALVESWKPVVANMNRISEAMRRLETLVQAFQKMNPLDLPGVLGGKISSSELKAALQSAEQREKEVFAQLEATFQELQQAFAAYNSQVRALLAAYDSSSHDEDKKRIAADTIARYNRQFDRGMSQLSHASRLLSKSKKKILEELERNEP